MHFQGVITRDEWQFLKYCIASVILSAPNGKTAVFRQYIELSMPVHMLSSLPRKWFFLFRFCLPLSSLLARWQSPVNVVQGWAINPIHSLDWRSHGAWKLTDHTHLLESHWLDDCSMELPCEHTCRTWMTGMTQMVNRLRQLMKLRT